MHIRVLRMDPDMKPLPGSVTVEIQDAKGIKVYKRTVQADRFGMAGASLPLSTEPNLGVWKLTANSGEQTAQLDVRVQEYVLPKYEITVDLPKEWVMGQRGRPLARVSAEYQFRQAGARRGGSSGLPLRGWSGRGTPGSAREIDGEDSLRAAPPPTTWPAHLPPADRATCSWTSPCGNSSTGYVEQTSRLLTVAASPVTLQLIPESASFSPGFALLRAASRRNTRPPTRRCRCCHNPELLRVKSCSSSAKNPGRGDC